MNDDLKREFETYAATQYPKEACAILMEDEEGRRLILAENSHHQPESFFQIHPKWYAHLSEEQFKAVVHSHPTQPPAPSSYDLLACEGFEKEMWIYSIPAKEWSHTKPTGLDQPLLGRTFMFGVNDCFTLLRDYYWQTLKIRITNQYRENDFWAKGTNLYLDHYSEEGFTRVSDLKLHDVILIQVGSDIPNHTMVYLGNGMAIHHIAKQLSCIQPYGGYWLKHTYGVYRHFSQC